jgi:hypothetical protein
MTDEKINFSSACAYLAALIKAGKTSQDPDITFDVAKSPIKNGVFVPALVDGYIGSKSNQPLVTALNEYYRKKYWPAGSDVLILWEVIARGKVLRVRTISNPYWDVDPIFRGKTELIMKVAFDYGQK